MPRRFGFWTLLVVSTAWAQGCTTTPNTKMEQIKHDLLIGKWDCSYTYQSEFGSINYDVVREFSTNKMHDMVYIKFNFLDPKDTAILSVDEMSNYSLNNNTLNTQVITNQTKIIQKTTSWKYRDFNVILMGMVDGSKDRASDQVTDIFYIDEVSMNTLHTSPPQSGEESASMSCSRIKQN